MHMDAVSNQFSSHPFGPGEGGERTRGAMEQRPHGIETMSHMGDTETYGLLSLLVVRISMTHTHSDACIYQEADHSGSSRQLRRQGNQAQVFACQGKQLRGLGLPGHTQPRWLMRATLCHADIGSLQVNPQGFGPWALILQRFYGGP